MRYTVVMSCLNLDDKTAFVMNKGYDKEELYKLITNGQSNGFEIDISPEEMVCWLNYIFVDTIVESVLEISNNYNRDQKVINQIKKNLETKLKLKGFDIIQHEWNPTVNKEACDKLYETRNFYEILVGNLKAKESEYQSACLKYDKIEDEIGKLNIDIKNLKSDIKDLTNDKTMMLKSKDRMQEEIYSIEYTLNEKKDISKEVYQQLELIKENKVKIADLELMIKEKKKSLDDKAEQEKRLDDVIKKKSEKVETINYISYTLSEIYKLSEETLNSLNKNINQYV